MRTISAALAQRACPSAAARAEPIGANPGRQILLRSALDLPRQIELDVTARYVSALSAPDVPSYTAVDARLAWQPRPGVELSVAGRNLIGPRHGEFTGVSTRSDFGRGVFIALTSRF